MIAHSSHASKSFSNVIIRSPDTDVFIIALNASLNIPASLFFETGQQKMHRIIPIDAIRQSIGDQWCCSLIGLHAFTGSLFDSFMSMPVRHQPLKITFHVKRIILRASTAENEAEFFDML